jgi:hypothetical protein
MDQAVRMNPSPAYARRIMLNTCSRYASSNSALESQALQPVVIPALAELQALLPSKIPSVAQEQQHAVLVHGDFKVDNLIYGSSGIVVLRCELVGMRHTAQALLPSLISNLRPWAADGAMSATF